MKKYFLDFVYVFKSKVIQVFAILGAVSTSAVFSDNSFFKRYFIELSSLNTFITFKEFIILVIIGTTLFIIDSFLRTIVNKKNINEKQPKTKARGTQSGNEFLYSDRARKFAQYARVIAYLLFIPLFILKASAFWNNNDFCESKYGKMAIKICQFSDNFERNRVEDDITLYIQNNIRNGIKNDTVEVNKELEQIKDQGSNNSILEKHLSCYNRGILVYGYRSAEENAFYCNIYLKNLKNLKNRVSTSQGVIVLDDPKLIRFKDSYKGKYISDFTLGLFFYYQKEYSRAAEFFAKLTRDTLPNQLSGYSHMYLGYSKLFLHDTTGYVNIRKASELDPANLIAKQISDDEKKGIVVSNNTIVENKDTSQVEKIKVDPQLRSIVSLDAYNIFYIDAHNPISVFNNKLSPSDFSVKLDVGQITGKDGYYNVTEKTPGIDTLRIFKHVAGNRKVLIFKRGYRVEVVKAPYLVFCGKHNGEVKSADLAKEDQVFVSSDLPIDIKFSVLGFTLVVDVPRGDPIVMYSTSNHLTNRMREVLNDLGNGMTLIFTGIQARSPNGKLRTLAMTKLNVVQ